jgi:hypothetical protein
VRLAGGDNSNSNRIDNATPSSNMPPSPSSHVINSTTASYTTANTTGGSQYSTYQSGLVGITNYPRYWALEAWNDTPVFLTVGLPTGIM